MRMLDPPELCPVRARGGRRRQSPPHLVGVTSERRDVVEQPVVVAHLLGNVMLEKGREGPAGGVVQLTAPVERPAHQRYRSGRNAVQARQEERIETSRVGPRPYRLGGGVEGGIRELDLRLQALTGAHAGTGRPSSSSPPNGGSTHWVAAGIAAAAWRSSSSIPGRAMCAATRVAIAGSPESDMQVSQYPSQRPPPCRSAIHPGP